MKKTYLVPNAWTLELETKDLITASNDIAIKDNDDDEDGNKWGPIQGGTPINPLV